MRSLVLLACFGLLACGEVNNPDVDAPPPADGTPDGPPPPMPRLHLKMDDAPGDGVLDSAGTHVTSCPSQTTCPMPVAGQVGGGYLFYNTRITVSPATDLSPGTGYTLALWVRVDQAPDPALGNAIIAAKNLSDLDASYALSVSPNLVPQFYSSSEASQNLDGNGILPVGAFHHLAAVWNGNSKTIFLDAAQVGSGPAAQMPNNANLGMTIGQRQSVNMPLTFFGVVDDVQLFDRALSQAEIAAIMNP